MTRYKTVFTFMMFLLIVGCTTGTSSTKSDTGLQPRKAPNCATIDLESLTSEERQFCHGGY
jgi:hypothetical protein